MYRSLSQPKTGHFRSVFGFFSEGHRRDVRPLQRWVHTHDCIGGCHFRAEMQVRIDVGSRRNIVLFVLPGLLFLFDRLISIRPKKWTGIRLCRKTCPGGNYGGKDRVKGNRQGVPFAFHDPPQRQNCNAAGKTRATNSGLTSGAESFLFCLQRFGLPAFFSTFWEKAVRFAFLVKYRSRGAIDRPEKRWYPWTSCPAKRQAAFVSSFYAHSLTHPAIIFRTGSRT